MLKRSVFIALIIFIGYSLKGQTTVDGRDELNAIRSAVPFLTIAPDSKSGAMGDAGVASKPDINSQHWNTSKYAFIEDEAGIALSYTPWLRSLQVTDLNLLYLSGFRRIDERMVLSGAVRYFNLGEIAEINEDGVTTGNKIRPNEFAVDLGYSLLFSEYISGGLAFRYIRSDIANGTSGLGSGGGAKYEPGNSIAGDITTYFQKPIQISSYDAEMAIGLNISNIGVKMTYAQDNESQFIPTNMRLGGRLTMDLDEYNSLSFMMDLNKLLVPTDRSSVDTNYDSQKIGVIEGVLKSFSDAPGGASEEFHEIMWSFGAEYYYMQQFAIRAGYFHEHATKGNRKYFTVGVGLAYNVFSLDFSYLFPATGGRSNPLANTMRFTLGFRFE
jgi:hypothetical protein